jgi:hypothetical protein
MAVELERSLGEEREIFLIPSPSPSPFTTRQNDEQTRKHRRLN